MRAPMPTAKRRCAIDMTISTGPSGEARILPRRKTSASLRHFLPRGAWTDRARLLSWRPKSNREEGAMDLGIAGRKGLGCAASKGLGKGRVLALAQGEIGRAS